MPTTDRVLSGSITKGSTATLSSSAEYFYQGINSRTVNTYFGTLVPRVGSGNRTGLYKEGKPISTTNFDDSLVINKTLGDMGGENDVRVEERIIFDLEKRQFGQAPTTLQGEPYADALDFDPVVYLKDRGEVMWPVNMWNAGSLYGHEYDGVIEPLDIRRELFGDLDTRYEGRAVRGGLVGGSSEKPWGSAEIKITKSLSDEKPPFFYDGPVAMQGGETIAPMQPYIETANSPGEMFIEKDYHNVVYSVLNAHNQGTGQDMTTALKMLNSSSCQDIQDPFTKMSNTGFYFGSQAGSIIFGDTYMIGEQE